MTSGDPMPKGDPSRCPRKPGGDAARQCKHVIALFCPQDNIMLVRLCLAITYIHVIVHSRSCITSWYFQQRIPWEFPYVFITANILDYSDNIRLPSIQLKFMAWGSHIYIQYRFHALYTATHKASVTRKLTYDILHLPMHHAILFTQWSGSSSIWS